jgi:hypothetical protein
MNKRMFVCAITTMMIPAYVRERETERREEKDFRKKKASLTASRNGMETTHTTRRARKE